MHVDSVTLKNSSNFELLFIFYVLQLTIILLGLLYLLYYYRLYV